MHKSFLANFICGNYCWKNQEFAGSGVHFFADICQQNSAMSDYCVRANNRYVNRDHYSPSVTYI